MLLLAGLLVAGALAFLAYTGYTALRARFGADVLAGLAPGACRRLPPIGSDQHYTVFLDPGHGSPDPGTSGVTAGGRVYEKDLALATAQTLATLLRRRGFTVVLSRTRDGPVARLSAADAQSGAYSLAGNHQDLAARVNCANAAHAKLLLSLHFNGFDDPTVGGAETFYDTARPFSTQSLRLAGLVQRNVIAQLAAAGWQIPDRGVADDATGVGEAVGAEAAAYGHLYELGPAQAGYLDEPSAMPGVLVEPLFLSDPVEATIAASGRGQQAIAAGLADAMAQFVQGAAAGG